MAKWQDSAPTADMMDPKQIARRVVNSATDIRIEGFSDLLLRARGASVIDVGMNKGHIAWEFVANGAAMVHGCDLHQPSVMAARHWFAEAPQVQSKFEVVDLTKPGAMAAAFGAQRYDIVMFLGTYHKLVRIMERRWLDALLADLVGRAQHFFVWTGYREHVDEVEDIALAGGLKRVHFSELSGAPAVIWKR